MKLKKCFKVIKLVFFLSLISQSSFAFVMERSCGDYIYKVDIIRHPDPLDISYKLYSKRNNQKFKLFYEAGPLTGVHASCLQDKAGKYFFLFREYDFGSHSPEDIYGLYDPELDKVLVKPSDWPEGDTKEVEKFITGELPDVDSNKSTFCCVIERTEELITKPYY